jgi:hypothetical protein
MVNPRESLGRWDARQKRRSCKLYQSEPQSLGDVNIVSSDADFELSVVAVKIVPTMGEFDGYVISTVVLCPLEGKLVSKLPESQNTPDLAVRYVNAYLSTKSEMIEHYVNVGADIPTICQRVVTKIDTQVFQPIRETFDRETKPNRK